MSGNSIEKRMEGEGGVGNNWMSIVFAVVVVVVLQ